MTPGRRIIWRQIEHRLRVVAAECRRIGATDFVEWFDDLDAGASPGSIVDVIRRTLAQKQIIASNRARDVLRALYRWEVRQCKKQHGYPIPPTTLNGNPTPWTREEEVEYLGYDDSDEDPR